MKKLKKALAGLTVSAMLMGLAPAALYTAMPDSLAISTAYAAKGGAKISIPKPAPKAPATSAPKSNASESKSVSGNGKDYAPSKDAKSLDKNAPASNSATAKNSTGAAAAGKAAQSSSRLGSMMRNIGLLAGGMFLGSMLASLFGLGGGFLADVLGLLMNIVLFAFVFMAIKWAIGKLMGRGKSSSQSYGGYAQTRRDEPINVTPKKKYPDIKQVSLKPDKNGYDAKSTADKYRNR